jgi:macrocin-O-methyltransferase TylF-like protien
MTAPTLRKKASGLLKDVYRLTQTLSRGSVDSHIENFVIQDFVNGGYGRAHGVDRKQRAELIERMRSAAGNIPSATRLLYHIVLARELLRISPEIAGDVIECGVFKGASSASLSLVCGLIGRKLWVCDSFAGLPAGESEITRNYPHQKVYGHYTAGMYAGTLQEVQENIRKYGNIDCCEFVRGFFSESLRAIKARFVLAFLDVDLTSSMQDCIKHVWPSLVDEGLVYTDDSCDLEVVRVWFDDGWWQQELGARAPGYVGSGCGLPLSVGGSSLGYAQKVRSLEKSYEKASWF